MKPAGLADVRVDHRLVGLGIGGADPKQRLFVPFLGRGEGDPFLSVPRVADPTSSLFFCTKCCLISLVSNTILRLNMVVPISTWYFSRLVFKSLIYLTLRCVLSIVLPTLRTQDASLPGG